MRSATRNNLASVLKNLREHRKASAGDRRNILKVLRNDEMQDELLRQVREKFGVNVDNLRDLLELFFEYAPQVLKLIAEIVKMF